MGGLHLVEEISTGDTLRMTSYHLQGILITPRTHTDTTHTSEGLLPFID